MVTLQTLPAVDAEDAFGDGIGKVAGFSLRAGVMARARERRKLERLCRCIGRPAVPEQRLSLTPDGNLCCQLRTPCRDGTTQFIFEPLDFIKRVFGIDIETCSECGGAVKVVACIEDPVVIEKSLDHLRHKAETNKSVQVEQ